MKLWDEQFYSKRLVFKYLKIILLFCALMAVSKGIAFVLILPLSLAALGRRDALTLFYCILLSTTSLIANGYFVPKGLVYGVTQRGMMVLFGGLLMLQIFGQRQSPYLKPMLGLLAYVFYMAAVSQTGYAPIISNLKLFLFFTTFMAYYAAATTLVNSKNVDHRKLRSMMVVLGIFFLIGSLLSTPFGFSNMIPKDMEEAATLNSLFRGLTNHSQELGPVVSFLGIFLLADMAFAMQRPNALYTILLLTVPYLVYKTSSRTAMGGLLAGVAILWYCLSVSKGVKRSWKNKVVTNMALGAMFLVAIAIAVPGVRKGVIRFSMKYSAENEKFDRQEAFGSRQGKWNEALYGWHQSPMFGNGFQVSSQMKGFQATSVASVLSAPIEKSTWIYAILDEGGTCGMIIFCSFALFALFSMMHRRAYIGVTLFATMLILNLGEFTMFSMSSMGGFEWAMIMAGLVFDSERQRVGKPMVFAGGPVMIRR